MCAFLIRQFTTKFTKGGKKILNSIFFWNYNLTSYRVISIENHLNNTWCRKWDASYLCLSLYVDSIRHGCSLVLRNPFAALSCAVQTATRMYYQAKLQSMHKEIYEKTPYLYPIKSLSCVRECRYICGFAASLLLRVCSRANGNSGLESAYVKMFSKSLFIVFMYCYVYMYVIVCCANVLWCRILLSRVICNSCVFWLFYLRWQWRYHFFLSYWGDRLFTYL